MSRLQRRDSFQSVLGNIIITLVSPQIPENIGLCARVIKNTSLRNLYLVNPNLTNKSFEVAKRARDVLTKASIFSDLNEAIKSSYFVVGTTRRQRGDIIIYNFREVLPLIIAVAKKRRVSIIFGKEDFGLSKKDSERCDLLFCLDANPQFSSYNLSMAVGIVCYEIYRYLKQVKDIFFLDPAKKNDIETMFHFIKSGLKNVGFSSRMCEAMIFSWRRIFRRTFLTKNEVQMIKSIFLKMSSAGNVK